MTWIRFEDDFPEDPDTLLVGEDSAWLHFLGTCYCSRNLTDGLIPKPAVPRLTAKRTAPLVKKLVDIGWWIDEGAHYRIRNYLKFQRSASAIEAERMARSEAGRKGAASRWGDKSIEDAMANGMAKASLHTDTHTQTDSSPPLPPSARGGSRANGTNPRALANAAKRQAAERSAAIAAVRTLCDDCGFAYDPEHPCRCEVSA